MIEISVVTLVTTVFALLIVVGAVGYKLGHRVGKETSRDLTVAALVKTGYIRHKVLDGGGLEIYPLNYIDDHGIGPDDIIEHR